MLTARFLEWARSLQSANLQIGKLFTERAAPSPGVADMFIEINDEQRRGWFLSYSIRLWRGRIGTAALPLVDFLQRSSHQRCLVSSRTGVWCRGTA
jgi:hypothetical protein